MHYSNLYDNHTKYGLLSLFFRRGISASVKLRKLSKTSQLVSGTLKTDPYLGWLTQKCPHFPYHTQLLLRAEQINDTLIHLRSNVLPDTPFPSFSWVYTLAIFFFHTFHRLKQKAIMKIKNSLSMQTIINITYLSKQEVEWYLGAVGSFTLKKVHFLSPTSIIDPF